MKLAVSYDAKGNILTLFDPAKLRGDKMTLTYVPAKGEKHEVLEVPKHLEGKSVGELAALLRVSAAGHPARFEPKA